MTRTIVFAPLVALAGCANQAPVEGRTCPCAEGYTCCATDVCVPDGAACSVVEPPQLDRTSQPCSADDDIAVDGTVDTHWVFHYDGLGNDVRDEGDEHLDGSVDDVLTYDYDDSRQLTFAVETIDGVEDFRETRTFDSFERVATDAYSDGQGDNTLDTWSYDGMTATRDTDYDGDGVVDLHGVIEQNSAGRPVSAMTTNADGSLSSTETWDYSSAGDVLEHDRFDPDGVAASRTTYTRDDASRLVHRTTVLRDGTVLIDFVNTYDDDGRLSVQTYTFDGQPTTEETLHYSCD